jgi:AcrR family transcriptional regulator
MSIAGAFAHFASLASPGEVLVLAGLGRGEGEVHGFTAESVVTVERPRSVEGPMSRTSIVLPYERIRVTTARRRRASCQAAGVSHVPQDQRRRQIIEAAVRVISEHGTRGATTRKIATAAGAPLGALHYSFRNKEEIFHAVMDYCRHLTIERFRAQVQPGVGVANAVDTLIRQFRDWTAAEPEFQIAQYELLFWASRTPSAQSFAPEIYGDWRALISAILTESLAESDDPAKIDRLTTQVMAVVDGMMLQIIALGDAGPTDEDVADFAASAVAGVA